VFFIWHISPTKTVADARMRETTIGSGGSGNATDMPRALNSLAGTKFNDADAGRTGRQGRSGATTLDSAARPSVLR
jgi:hypothetical protein